VTRAVTTAKAKEWLRRYLPAEIIGTATALAGAYGTHALTNSPAAAAIAGSISETIGFYSYFAVRDGKRYYDHHRAHPKPRRILLASYHTVRDMLIEFGPAEVLDSALVRPLCMYIGPQLLHNFGAGLLAGKLASDVVFYVFAAAGYEVKLQWHRRRKTGALQ